MAKREKRLLEIRVGSKRQRSDRQELKFYGHSKCSVQPVKLV